MTRDEILQRLQTIKDKGNRALRLLASKPLSSAAQAEIQSLARGIKEELQREYDRMLPERVQRTMTMFELSVYSPTIEETWKDSGRLKVDNLYPFDCHKPGRCTVIVVSGLNPVRLDSSQVPSIAGVESPLSSS
jgi:hypothetical protein